MYLCHQNVFNEKILLSLRIFQEFMGELFQGKLRARPSDINVAWTDTTNDFPFVSLHRVPRVQIAENICGFLETVSFTW